MYNKWLVEDHVHALEDALVLAQEDDHTDQDQNVLCIALDADARFNALVVKLGGIVEAEQEWWVDALVAQKHTDIFKYFNANFIKYLNLH